MAQKPMDFLPPQPLSSSKQQNNTKSIKNSEGCLYYRPATGGSEQRCVRVHMCIGGGGRNGVGEEGK